MVSFIKQLYLTPRLFMIAGGFVTMFVVSFFFRELLDITMVLFYFFLIAIFLDMVALFILKEGMFASREMAEKLSNGDDNVVTINLENYHNFPVTTDIADELPFQFQARNKEFHKKMKPRSKEQFTYIVHPVKRGSYNFGALNIYVKSPAGLVSRRYKFAQDMAIPVYPSFIQMKKYEFYAISNRLTEYGIKKIRRIGHNFEFEQIKEYVKGDDFRTINWKATARKGNLMVNQFQDERSQQVYCIIDKGRVMKMPFNRLTLLDYSINASLVLSNIALKKFDKAGLLTFTNKNVSVLKADRKNAQLHNIAEMLYDQKTAFLESNYELLFSSVRRFLTQRSLCILFTNFEAMSSMKRNLSYFKAIAAQHVLVVVFFENTEMNELISTPAVDLEGVYIKTIAEKFFYDKKLIVKELNRNGIYTILTSPENLTINTINKYLELKARGIL